LKNDEEFLVYHLQHLSYSLTISFFRLAGIFNEKIRNGLLDRRKLYENLIIDLTGLDRSKKMVWFHSSSMGEFEQAKPIIQKLKSENDINLIITFFSPSGYRNSLNYPFADVISYIPFDTKLKAKRFINLVRPDLAVFMRYDIWPNFVWELKLKNIATILVDATMRENSKRKWLVAKSFHKSLFKNITQILTVSDNDSAQFKEFGLEPAKIYSVGDTRFDRVYHKCIEAKEKHILREGIFENKKVFVFGSSWEADENIVLPAFLKLIKYEKNAILILVPHEPTLLHLEKLENNFTRHKINSIRFSFLNQYSNEQIIIVDSIGILLTLYYYADLAYVGGSFKQGIHNVLEPAVYGIPLFYGPKIENSIEAKLLEKNGGAKIINNKKQAYRFLRTIFLNEKLAEVMGKVCDQFVKKNLGATEKIYTHLKKYL
jgi:3-deoxy-D-manno-octulosonic-acid transferase